MPAINPTFNPANVMLQKPGGNPPFRLPFTPGGTVTVDPTRQKPTPPSQFGNAGLRQPGTGTGTTLGAQTVRASGTGPYDDAYRQNLATYAGGLFNRPGGNLSFNPTGNLQDLGGTAVGGGNAPLFGGPQNLLSMALGGQPFNYQPPKPKATPQMPFNPQFWQQWLDGMNGPWKARMMS